MAARAGESLQGDTVGIRSAVAVDISSTDATLARVTRGIYVGTPGDLVVQFADDNANVTIPALAAGFWHPMQVQKIVKSGTLAAGILAGY